MLKRRASDDNTPPTRSPPTTEDLMMPLTPPASDVTTEGHATTAAQKIEHRFETTADGDVRTIVVEPSFDAFEKNKSSLKQEDPSMSESSKERDPAMMSPDHREGAPDQSPDPATFSVAASRGHSRNLSAQFYEGLRVSEHGLYPVQQSSRLDEPEELSPHVKTNFAKPEVPSPGQDPAMDRSVGQKHYRGFSGDLLNPPHVHRRMNSTGNSVQVDRSGAIYHQELTGYSMPRTAHHRKTSSGLDMLSAAAGVSQEDLAIAAGASRPAAGHASSTPWDPPSSETQKQRRSPVEGILRMSPSAVSSGSYDYSRQGPPPGRYGGPRHAYAPPSHGHSPGYHQGPAPPGAYPPPPSAYHHPMAYYSSVPPPQSYGAPHASYPVQFAPPRGASLRKGPRADPSPLSQQPTLCQTAYHAGLTSSGERVDTDERVLPWRQQSELSGITTGAQTMVTAIDVGQAERVIHAAPTTRTASTNTDHGANPASVPATVSHHRRHSSFGSLSTMLGSGLFPEQQPPASAQPKPHFEQARHMDNHQANSANPSYLLEDTNKRPPHHRSTSSTASFLNYLENQPLSNEAFMQAVAAPGPGFAPPQGASYPGYSHSPAPPLHYGRAPAYLATKAEMEMDGAASKLASGGASKRVRRKCTAEGCSNRVVQGGRCISHGAKRKQCKHPGCTKNVKKAGLCSAHGPARKRCDTDGCNKVAVQGGKCIAHGAKKKLCTTEGCTKQAILAGMCKKHHDLNLPSHPLHETPAPPHRAPRATRPSHARGLSIFQEITPDAVQDLLNPPPAPESY